MTAVIVLLLLVGFVLLAIEIVIIPGFGVTGILGIGGLVAGSAMAFYLHGPLVGVGVVIGTIAAGVLLVVLVGRSKLSKAMELKPMEGGSGVPQDLARFVGKEGVAATLLRPAGVAEVEGEKISVRSEGRFVAKGVKIRVISVEGATVVVEPIEELEEGPKQTDSQAAPDEAAAEKEA